MSPKVLRAGVIAALLATGASVRAKDGAPTPEEVDRARTFFSAGAAAYGAARYVDAVRSFEQAYALAPRPPVLFSLAQAERKAYFATNAPAYLRHAIQHYKSYLDAVKSGGRRSEAIEAKADLEARLSRLDPAAEASAAPSREERHAARITVYSPTPGAKVSIDGGAAEELPYFGDLPRGKHKVRVFADGYFDAEQEVSGDKPIDVPVSLTLRDRPAVVTVALASAADVYVDGRIVATTPLSRPIEVPPGTHVIGVAANGKKPFSQEIRLERGKPFTVEPHLETSGQRIVAWTMIVGGGLGVVGGAVFGLAALGREDRVREIEDAAAAGNISAADLEEHNRAIDRRDTFRTVSIVGLSVGGAIAVAGALLYVFDKPNVAVLPPRSVEPAQEPSKPDQLEITARPVLGPGHYGAGATVRF